MSDLDKYMAELKKYLGILTGFVQAWKLFEDNEDNLDVVEKIEQYLAKAPLLFALIDSVEAQEWAEIPLIRRQIRQLRNRARQQLINEGHPEQAAKLTNKGVQAVLAQMLYVAQHRE